MKKLNSILNAIFTGWSRDFIVKRPKTFWRYLLRYPHNYTWTFGSILFIVLLVGGAIKYEAPVFWWWAMIPFILMVYNFVSEYFAFKGKGKGKLLAIIFYGACAMIVLYTAVRIFIIGA